MKTAVLMDGTRYLKALCCRCGKPHDTLRIRSARLQAHTFRFVIYLFAGIHAIALGQSSPYIPIPSSISRFCNHQEPQKCVLSCSGGVAEGPSKRHTGEFDNDTKKKTVNSSFTN